MRRHKNLSKGNFSDMTLSLVKQTNKKQKPNKNIRQPSLLGELKPQSEATSFQTEHFPLLSEYTHTHALAHRFKFQFSVQVIQHQVTFLQITSLKQRSSSLKNKNEILRGGRLTVIKRKTGIVRGSNGGGKNGY